MKKQYLSPDVCVNTVSMEKGFLTESFNGSSSTDLTITDYTNDDDWDF